MYLVLSSKFLNFKFLPIYIYIYIYNCGKPTTSIVKAIYLDEGRAMVNFRLQLAGIMLRQHTRNIDADPAIYWDRGWIQIRSLKKLGSRSRFFKGRILKRLL